MICLILSLVIGLSVGVAHGRTQTFTGKAYSETGELAYIERHVVNYNGENVIESRTTYFDPDNRVIGSLNSEYTPTPQFCDYTFMDLRKDYTDGVQVKKDSICMYRKEGVDAKKETVCLPKEEGQIIGQGFHHFIINHLAAIAEGKVFHVKLVMPSRLDQFDFRIKKNRIEGKRILIRLEIDNWFLRLLTPSVDTVYGLENARLIRYEGTSNVADASGRFNKVQIDYRY